MRPSICSWWDYKWGKIRENDWGFREGLGGRPSGYGGASRIHAWKWSKSHIRNNNQAMNEVWSERTKMEIEIEQWRIPDWAERLWRMIWDEDSHRMKRSPRSIASSFSSSLSLSISLDLSRQRGRTKSSRWYSWRGWLVNGSDPLSIWIRNPNYEQKNPHPNRKSIYYFI